MPAMCDPSDIIGLSIEYTLQQPCICGNCTQETENKIKTHLVLVNTDINPVEVVS